MPSSGGYTKVTTDIILDDTIIDADIKATANITRSKMNETQNVLVKAGAFIQVFEPAGVKNIKLIHDGSNATLENSAGNFFIIGANGLISLLKAGSNSLFDIYGAGGVKYLRLTHNDTDAEITTQAGNLKFNPAGSIQALKDIVLNVGKGLYLYNAGTTNYGLLNCNGGGLILSTQSDGILLQPNSGLTYFNKAAIDNFALWYSQNGVNYCKVGHNGTGGLIETNVGDLIFNPAGNVNCNNKALMGFSSLSYQASVYGYIAHFANAASAESAAAQTQKSVVSGALGVLDAAATTYYYTIPVNFPDGVNVQELKVWYWQSNNSAVMQVDLMRMASNGNYIQMATVNDENIATAYGTVIDNTIVSGVINILAYGYCLRIALTNASAANQIKCMYILVSYFTTHPKN